MSLSGTRAAGVTAHYGGWIYVFRGPHAVKVGITKRDPESRRIDVEKAVGLPIELIAVFACDDRNPWHVERRTHEALAAKRTFGEWFDCSAEEAVAAVVAAMR